MKVNDELTLEDVDSMLAKDRRVDFNNYVIQKIESETNEAVIDVDSDLAFDKATADDLESLREVKPIEIGDIYFNRLHKNKHDVKLKQARSHLARKMVSYTNNILRKRIDTLNRVIKTIDRFRISGTGLLYQTFKADKSERSMNMIPKLPKAVKTTKYGVAYFDPDVVVEELQRFIRELDAGDFSSFPDIARKRSSYLQRQTATMWNRLNSAIRSDKSKIFKKLKIKTLPISYKDVWYAPSDFTEYVMGNICFSELTPFDFTQQYIDNKGRARYRETKSLVNAHKSKQVEYKIMKSVVKNETKHKRKFDLANQRKFLSVFKETLNVSAACNACGISRAYLYKFANDDSNKAFNFAFNSLRDDLTVNVEKKFLDTVLNGQTEVKYDGSGNMVNKTVKDAPPALLLRALDTLSETYKKLPDQADLNVNIKQDNSHLVELAAALGVNLSTSEIESYMKAKDVTPEVKTIEHSEYEYESEDIDESEEYEDEEDDNEGLSLDNTDAYLDITSELLTDDFEVAGKALLDSLSQEVKSNE